MPTDWVRVTAIATALGSAGVIISLGVTSCQIQLARQTLQASTVYNIEKDFSEIFAKRLDAKFVECYRPLSDQNKSGSGLNLPSICPDPTARDTFFDILNLYRMLLDMAKLGGSPRRIRQRANSSLLFLSDESFWPCQY
jgi:hypothetical protein